jgi:Tol biopolymer transport system component
MKHALRFRGQVMAASCAAMLLIPVLARAQAAPAAPDDRAKVEAEARERAITRLIEQNASQLTLFDRQGKLVAPIGPRDLYTQPVLSPDRSHVAVIVVDPRKQTNDLFVVDVASGQRTQITTSQMREPVAAPAWSPDGKSVGYVAMRGSRYGIYRRAADGSGPEERLYEHAGGPIVLTDWSLDNKFLSYYASDLAGSSLFLLPLDGDRQPVEVAHSEKQIVAARLSPDNRFLAYRSNETGRDEIFVREVPPAGSAAGAQVGKWQITTDGGTGMVWWRRDGRELYFLGPGRTVMYVEVKPGQDFEFSRPKRLFTAPDAIPLAGNPGGLGSVSRDGERVVFAVPPGGALRQVTVFDRQGNVVSRVGEPGLYVQPSMSPDGSKLAVMRQDPQSGVMDIWALDIRSGKATPVTTDPEPENAPIWSDATHIAYVSMRQNYAGVYRKSWDGRGSEEQLFRYTPGAGLVLTDFSPDGKYFTADGGAIVLVVPLAGSDPLKREAVDFSRSEYEAGLGRFSPDGKFVAYGSNETGLFEVYVRPFDPASGSAAGEQKWKISTGGAIGGIVWRRDGRELFYLTDDKSSSDVHVMAVDITTSPTFQSGTPKELFRVKGPLPGNPGQWKHISPDGQRFVFAVPVPANTTR